ncbi:MAG: hypothetical protein IH571_04065, partial [Acholeplasmataceae bacterium]|nr:hypothetical protein [Acholeplasmataceae bacterium]
MKRRLTIFICTIALTIIFAFLIPHVKTNYDMTKYLPDDSDTRVGIAILEEEFGVRTMIQILVDDVSIEQVTTIKNEILDVNLVESVVWLD